MSEQLSMDSTWNSHTLDTGQSRRFPFPWTAEQVEVLKAGIAAGDSFSTIAAALGCSRNTCIGKARRLGLKGPPKPPKPRHSKLHPDRQYKPISRRKPTMDIDNYQSPMIECVPLNVTFMELTDAQCRYVIGEPAGDKTIYCGHPVAGECSYCWPHFALTHDLSARQLRKAA